MKAFTIFIIALTVMIFSFNSASADDMWSETPDLLNFKSAPFVSEPSRLSYKLPAVDMWAETPDLNSNSNSNDFFRGNVGVTSGLADPELYAETPDLRKVAPAETNRRTSDDIMVAEVGKKMNKPIETN